MREGGLAALPDRFHNLRFPLRVLSQPLTHLLFSPHHLMPTLPSFMNGSPARHSLPLTPQGSLSPAGGPLEP